MSFWKSLLNLQIGSRKKQKLHIKQPPRIVLVQYFKNCILLLYIHIYYIITVITTNIFTRHCSVASVFK